MPALLDDAVLRLTRRYQELLQTGSSRAMPQLQQAWAALSSYDESSVAEFEKAIGTVMQAVKKTAVNVSAGYLSSATGLPPAGIAIDAVRSGFDAREPFISMWNALQNGVPFDEARLAGQRRAEAMLRTYMTSTARRTGDHYLTSIGVTRARWRRIPDSRACPWCILVSGQLYKSAESADFGHRNCGCTVLPAVEGLKAEAISRAAAAEVPQPPQQEAPETQAAPVERERGSVLTEAQYQLLKPGWNLPKQRQTVSGLRATPEGRLLHDTLKGFQSGTNRQIPLLRTNIEKRLTGQPLEPGAQKRVDNLLNAIRESPIEPPKMLYRGMRLDGSPEAVIARYSKADTLDLNLSSFSSDKALAKDFTIKGAGQKGPKTKTQTGVLIELEGGGVKALPIENIAPSRVFANEREWISGGRFAVDSVTQTKDGTVVLRLRQLAALGD